MPPPALPPAAAARRRRRTLARYAAPVLAQAAASAPAWARAQPQSVTGQVTVLERAGVRTPDLADAVVWLEPAGGAGAPPGAALGSPSGPTFGDPLGGAPSAAPAVAMRGRAYVPRVRVARAGATVAFPNQDPFRHNVFSTAGPAAFDLGLYERGASRGARLARPGVYPVFCDIHARMVAFVVVVATPWAAQPTADGRFAIPGVPPGRYTLRAWHERGGTRAQPLVVAAPAAAPAPGVLVALDARAYRPTPHFNKFGQPYADAAGERY